KNISEIVSRKVLSAAGEVTPLARLNEACPIERVFAAFAFQHRQLRLPQRFGPAETLLQAGIERSHHFACDRVAHRPQAHDQRFGAGQDEGAAKTVYSLDAAHFADADIAGGERYQSR